MCFQPNGSHKFSRSTGSSASPASDAPSETVLCIGIVFLREAFMEFRTIRVHLAGGHAGIGREHHLNEIAPRGGGAGRNNAPLWREPLIGPIRSDEPFGDCLANARLGDVGDADRVVH